MIAWSCKQIHSSDVRATVSGLRGKNATGRKSKVGSFECQGDCAEFRPHASHKGLHSKQILQKNVEQRERKIKAEMRKATEVLNENWGI